MKVKTVLGMPLDEIALLDKYGYVAVLWDSPEEGGVEIKIDDEKSQERIFLFLMCAKQLTESLLCKNVRVRLAPKHVDYLKKLRKSYCGFF